MGPVTPGGKPIAQRAGATLDFDAALAAAEGHCPTPTAPSERSRRTRPSPTSRTSWAEWLLELRRLLAGGGRLVVGLASPSGFEALTGTTGTKTGSA